MITFSHTSPPVTDSDLDDLELRFGFRFPDPIREHYLQFNGGHPNRTQFSDQNGTCVVHDFLPIKTSAIATLSTLEKCVQWLKIDQQVIPNHLVPFASDPFGNFFCFSIAKDDFGAIYWFKTEGNESRRAEFLSRSFDEFLAKLKM